MQDHAFLQQFENCTLPKENFKHKGHLRIAWIYLCHHPFPLALEHIAAGIKKYAASLGASQIYHETMTQAWARLVSAAMQAENTETFDQFIHLHPQLLNSNALAEYYSPECLASNNAKCEWVQPDLKSF